jgi:iron(III) transport system ATP-binding protein/sulfate transport system ATP-binding protein/putative spermidine/putrescine transport system ATP-binding protein
MKIRLARALITNPQLLLLDEPFSSIDNEKRDELRLWVKNLLKEEGIASLFITHDIEEAMLMGDRVVVFAEQKNQQIGKPMDVYEEPATPFVAKFYSDGLLIDANSFVHSKKLTVAKEQAEESYQSYKGTVVQKKVKHGSLFYDIQMEALNQKLTLTSIRFTHFLLGTVLGIIPGTFAFNFLGSSFVEGDYTYMLVAVVVLLLIAVIPIFFKDRLQKFFK